VPRQELISEKQVRLSAHIAPQYPNEPCRSRKRQPKERE